MEVKTCDGNGVESFLFWSSIIDNFINHSVLIKIYKNLFHILLIDLEKYMRFNF